MLMLMCRHIKFWLLMSTRIVGMFNIWFVYWFLILIVGWITFLNYAPKSIAIVLLLLLKISCWLRVHVSQIVFGVRPIVNFIEVVVTYGISSFLKC